jgi:ATP-dependent Clp endopeptidase proteolytic subunit ClpP
MTKLDKDLIESFHNEGIYPPTKTIKIEGEIDDDLASKTLANLHLLDQVTGEITILLSSNGGCVTAGFKIYDAIKACKNYVRIIAYGEVASMATVIFQAADEGRRFMATNAYLMLHEGDTEVEGKKRDRKAWERLYEWQEKNCMNIYWEKVKEKKPRAKRNVFENKVNDSDWILFPKEAIEQGLADEIIEKY